MTTNSLAPLHGRSFLATTDLTPDELKAVVEAALVGKQAGLGAFGQPLAGRGLGLVFFNPSLRTRASMMMAAHQLGGLPMPLDVGAGTWSLEHRDGVVMDGEFTEHVREAVPVLGEYVAVLGVRCFPGQKSLAADRAEPVLGAFARHSTVPVINLESAMHHPCQALADMLTIRERFGALGRQRVSLVWANHPKPLPHAVPNSFALAALQAGLELTVAAPPEYLPDDQWAGELRQAAALTGASLRFTTEKEAAYDGAQVIYAKSWASPVFYGDGPRDVQCRRRYADWQVTDELMARTDSGLFMHCLPVRRNVVVSDAVLDGPRSIVVQQAGNRLHAQKALLAAVLGALP